MNMIKTFLFVILFLLFNINTTFGQASMISKVSSKIKQRQMEKKLIERIDGISFYENIRNKLIAKDSLNFIGTCDTVFFLETYDLETGISYGRIWNSIKAISYAYFKDGFTFNDISFFDAETLKLVYAWDVNSIRKYASENSTMTSPLTILASRAIFNRENIEIDCLKFDEFYIH